MTTTTSTVNRSSIPPPNPRTLFPKRSLSIPSTKLPTKSVFSTRRTTRTVKCRGKGSPGSDNGSPIWGNGGSLKDLLSGMVDERVEELLMKEENRGLLDGLEQATMRVEMAKRELAEIEKQEIEAKLTRDYINQLESRAAEIEECQKQISEAKAIVEEAERSLDLGSKMSNKDEERLESVKAASIAAVIGTLAEIPVALTQVTNISELILPLAIAFLSCALFGVTFRYAIRRDLDNIQLKSGTSAAFGFAKGLGMLGAGPPLELEAGSILSHAFDGALYVSESLLIFLFAGVALDFCFKLRFLSPFPIDPSVPRT